MKEELTMPHERRIKYSPDQTYKEVGAMPNTLITAKYCDSLAKTPYHKNVRVRMAKVMEGGGGLRDKK